MQRRLRIIVAATAAAGALALGAGTALASDSDGPVNTGGTMLDQGKNNAAPTVGTDKVGNLMNGTNLLGG